MEKSRFSGVLINNVNNVDSGRDKGHDDNEDDNAAEIEKLWSR